MPNEIALKWLDALRSGKYKQVTGHLRKVEVRDAAGNTLQEGYCCLGVLCDLVDPLRWVAPTVTDATGSYFYVNPNPRNTALPDDPDEEDTEEEFTDKLLAGYPPQEYLERVGLTEADARELAVRNDRGYSFEQIAVMIEDMLADKPTDAG